MKLKASALIVFNHGRHTTELMSTKNVLHKSHSNNEQPKKVIGGGTIFFEDAPLEHSGSTFLIEFSFMDFVSFRAPDNAVCFVLVFRELLPT